LQDPVVHNSALEDVVTLPFDILFRTLALPFHLVDSMVNPTPNEKSKSKFNTEDTQ